MQSKNFLLKAILLFLANITCLQISSFAIDDTLAFVNNEHSYIDKELEDANFISKAIYEKSEVFHLFSHGKSGKILIKNEWKDAKQIAIWLSENDFLANKNQLNIYACEFAKGENGKAAVAYLEETLGICVAASDDITGIDGDWELEVGYTNSSVVIADYAYSLQGCDVVSTDVSSSGITSENGATSLTFTHPATTTSDNRLLVVGVAIGDNVSSNTGSIGAAQISSVTYGGTNLTLLGAQTETATGNTEARVEIWYLLNPVTTSASIVVTASATEVIAAGATTFSGVDQATPLGAFQFAEGGNMTTTASFNGIVSAADEVVYSTIGWEYWAIGTSNALLTVDGGSTLAWGETHDDRIRAGGATTAGAATVNVTYTNDNANATNDAGYVIGAVSIKPATCNDTGGTSFPPADYTINNGGTINTCTGIFADSGDTNGSYSDSENYTMTFCSDQNNHISFTFEHFNIEATNDALTIYDGNSTGASQIGVYSGSGSGNSPGVITSSGSCLTFEFISNGSTSNNGWIASISCTGLPSASTSAASWTGYPSGSTCSSNIEIGGVVYEDINNDGDKDSREGAIKGIVVSIFDDNGQVGASTTTDENGEYVFSSLSASTVYRIEFTVPNGWEEGAFGAESGTSVQFVDAASCDVSLGLLDVSHYCDSDNPHWVIPCYVNGDPQYSSNINDTGVARFEYNDSGDSPTATYVNYVTAGAVGTVWGTAFGNEGNKLYMSSVLKRHAGLGPNGIGAIYEHTDGAPNTSASLFYDFGSVAGIVEDNSTRFPGGGNTFGQEGACGVCDNIDPSTFGQIGKVGFGDLETNPDQTKLYVTNLFDRKVYSIDLDNPVAGSATPLPNIPWLDNSVCNNGIARPWALEFRRGTLYVGVICDASLSSCTPTSPCGDLTAEVYSFDGSSWANELSVDLDYYRKAYSKGSDYFVRWIDDWNVMKPYVSNKTDANFAQPILMDIEFDDDNAMILGIGDRSGFQQGYQAPPPPGPISSTEEENMSFGDILRASYDINSDTYIIENNGVAGSLTSTNPTSNSGIGGKSFYWGDYWTGIGANKYQGGIGNLALLPGSGEVLFGLADAIDYYSNGVVWLDNTDGSAIKKLEVYQGVSSGNSPFFAKSAGIGDIELFCGPPPIEIGNIVWWDDDQDGLQDPSEPKGFTVLLI